MSLTPNKNKEEAVVKEAEQIEINNFEKQQILNRKRANAIAANWSLAWVSGEDKVIANNPITSEAFEGTMAGFNQLLAKFRE